MNVKFTPENGLTSQNKGISKMFERDPSQEGLQKQLPGGAI